MSFELGSLVLPLHLFFVKNFAVILVEARECGSRALPCEVPWEHPLLGSSQPSTSSVWQQYMPWVVLGPFAQTFTTYDLESGPWARLPRSFSCPPPPSHGMSRFGVRVCLHVLKFCLYYFLELLDDISSESLVPS